MSEITISGIDKLLESQQKDLYRYAVSCLERELFPAALAYYKGNVTKAAAVLGLARITFRRKLEAARKHNNSHTTDISHLKEDTPLVIDTIPPESESA